MAYRLETSKEFDKFLAKHPKLAPKVSEAFEIIVQDPFAKTHLDIKKLKKEKNGYRLRIGKYRFLYRVIKEKVLVYAYEADSRGDVYK